MGAPKQTIGYRYYLSLLMGLSRGPIDELRMIKVGDKIAWDSHACNADTQIIDKPELFGGDKKEGGIQGPFRLFMGDEDQVLPGAAASPVGTLPDVQASIGGLISEFRGVATIWFSGLVSAMNPYLKEWKFRVRRSRKGWFGGEPWYPAKAAIYLAGGEIHAMNASHIIYESCTNPEWGRGLPTTKLDENSFIYAANTLCSEAFGICLVWYRKEDIEVFIKKVLDLVGAALYTDRETGLTVLKLIRDDYNINDLPLFTPETGLLDITDDDSASGDSSFNEIIGTGRDPITNQDFQIRAQNLASFQAQQSISSLDQDYRGIPTKELLARVVMSDLRGNALGLKRYNVVLDRRAWRIAPGMAFRISAPNRGIGNTILRVAEIDDGNMIDGKIKIKAIQDVFGLPDTTYIEPVDSSWTPPSATPLPAAEERLYEANYRDLLQQVSEADAQAADPDSGYIGTLARSPVSSSYLYDLASMADGEADWTYTDGNFTGNARLAGALTPGQTEVEVSDEYQFEAANVGQALLIGNEIVILEAYDPDTHMVTLGRGAADTVPASHLVNAVVWTLDDDLVTDGREYVEGDTVLAKVLTRTSSERLALDDAATLTLDPVGRHARPYPPGDVQVDGEPFYAVTGEHVEPVFTWTHRDRITQADTLVPHPAASVGPEPGVTYTIRLFSTDDLDTPIRTTTAIAGTTWTYTLAMQGADGGPSQLVVEIEAMRDGLASYQLYRFGVTILGGWGYKWGYNYGG